MADATVLPTLEFFQWSRPTAANPRLAAPITDSATTITVTNPPLDEDGKIVAAAFLMGVKNKAGYTETVYVPAAGVQGSGNTPDTTNLGLTITAAVRGINTSGLDFSTTASLAAEHEQDSPVFCNVSAIHFDLIQAAQKGTIGSGGENWQVGNAANNDITVYAFNGDANKPFWRYVAASNGWYFSNDGVSSTAFGTGAGVTGGANITVTAGDIALDSTITGAHTYSGASTFSSDVLVAADIQHDGDTNNKITFTTDAQSLETGGTSRIDISDSGVRLGAANARVTTVLDEDSLVSDSATSLATQQSIKAYADSLFFAYPAQMVDTETGSGTLVTSGLYNIHTSAASTNDRINYTSFLQAREGEAGPLTFAMLSNGDVIDVEFTVLTASNSAVDLVIGFVDIADMVTDVTVVNDKAYFKSTNGTLESSTGDGTTEEDQSVTGITLTNFNTYRIVLTVGTDCKFYVNGVLKTTHSTNIPDGVGGGSISCGIGVKTTENVAKSVSWNSRARISKT